MKTLVACPVSEKKDYAIERWAQATRGYSRLVSLDSREDYGNRLKKAKVPYILYDTSSDNIHGQLFNDAWRAIIENAGAKTHILSLEVDVLPQDGIDILSVMEGSWDDNFDFLCHGTPWRGKPWRKTLSYEMCCTLGSLDSWSRALDQAEANQDTLYTTIRHFHCHDVVLTNLIHLDKEEM